MDISRAVKLGSYDLVVGAVYTPCRMMILEDKVISTVVDSVKNFPCRVDMIMLGAIDGLFQVVEIWPIIALVKSCEDDNASGSRR